MYLVHVSCVTKERPYQQTNNICDTPCLESEPHASSRQSSIFSPSTGTFPQHQDYHYTTPLLPHHISAPFTDHARCSTLRSRTRPSRAASSKPRPTSSPSSSDATKLMCEPLATARAGLRGSALTSADYKQKPLVVVVLPVLQFMLYSFISSPPNFVWSVPALRFQL